MESTYDTRHWVLSPKYANSEVGGDRTKSVFPEAQPIVDQSEKDHRLNMSIKHQSCNLGNSIVRFALGPLACIRPHPQPSRSYSRRILPERASFSLSSIGKPVSHWLRFLILAGLAPLVLGCNLGNAGFAKRPQLSFSIKGV